MLSSSFQANPRADLKAAFQCLKVAPQSFQRMIIVCHDSCPVLTAGIDGLHWPHIILWFAHASNIPTHQCNQWRNCHENTNADEQGG